MPPTPKAAKAKKPPAEPAPPRFLVVRATVNLAGLPAGSVTRVDPSVPYMKMCLESKALVPVEAP